MKTWSSILPFVALLLPALIAADCDDFTFTGQGGSDGATEPYPSSFPVSASINCTTSLASQDGGKNDKCEFHHYNMGLVVHPTINLTTINNSTRDDIFALVKDKASSAADTDFNTTIVVNYTAHTQELSVGQAGHVGFTPYLRCWEGVVSDCDDDDDDDDVDVDEDTAVRVCGLIWLGGTEGLSPGLQEYRGEENFVSSNVDEDANGDLQPSYDSVAGQAIVTQGDDGAAINENHEVQ
ncbi:hypothetical protein M426DRAFT_16515 [Hypoxylon sp. CI-4A]|nr:hypothetical protein M426DRAFT_16515 [Hypoxylon sp. CI-4A]